MTRTPAARKTPAKSPAKPPASRATRLPATTTPTADTADAVEAAAEASSTEAASTASGSSVAGAPAADTTAADTTVGQPASGQPDTARPATGRPTAAKAAAAKAAAAKSESAAKAGAARAAATKAAAAKAAAARTSASAASRAATAAAASAATARAAADGAADKTAADKPVIDETAAPPGPAQEAPVPASPAQDSPTSPARDSAANDTVAAETAVEVSAIDEITAALAQPAAVAGDSGTAAVASTPGTAAEPVRTERRPFWRLNRTTPKPGQPTQQVPVATPAVSSASADSATADAPETTTAPAAAKAPAAPVTKAAPPAAPVVRKPLAPRTAATPVVNANAPVEIAVSGLNKRFGQNVAVAGVDLEVRAGSFYGIVGPNGAGKTTTLSMITGLLRPDSGTIHVHGIDVWADPIAAKQAIGVLPDRLRLFDRLTGAQLLYYSGVLRGLEAETVRARSADLAAAFGLESALNRLVADYSAGMTKKIALACAMIHSPRVLVLDEPFESVDPVSAVNVTEILQRYVASGGTVILSSHGMDLIQRVCDHVAIIVQGSVLASGTIDEVRGNVSLEERFVDLAGGRKVAEGLEWLHNFSD